MKRISFCIPTYNHAQFLGSALDSIISCWDDDCEIVIVDGASTDNTKEVASRYAHDHSRIRYIRQPVNRGVDPDIAEAIAAATGHYCWLFSSDDMLDPKGLEKIRQVLQDGSDIYLGARWECTKEMEVFAVKQWFRDPQDRQLTLKTDQDLDAYFCSANSIGALFSYISCIIFRKESWVRAGDSSAFFGTCYAHAHRLLRVMAHGANLTVVTDPIVLCRSDNDQFAARGLVRRYLLDFEGYRSYARNIFATRPTVEAAMLGVIRRDHNLMRLGKLFSACKDTQSRERVHVALVAMDYNPSVIKIASLLGRAEIAISFLSMAKRVVGRTLGKYWGVNPQ